MEKFVYSENELQTGSTQCDLCIFKDETCEKSCQKYEQKPQAVLDGECRCPYLRLSDIFDF